MRTIFPYAIGIIVGALGLWLVALPHRTPLEFGTEDVGKTFGRGLNELYLNGIDVRKSTRIALEPTTDCPTIAGSPCVRIEATRPVSPRSFSSDTVEVFIPMEEKSEH